MRNLHLTQTGEKMQKDGLLPGATDENRFTIYYDVITNLLMETVGNNYKSNATGIPTNELKSAEDVDFPNAMVRQLLEEKKTGNKKDKWS